MKTTTVTVSSLLLLGLSSVCAAPARIPLFSTSGRVSDDVVERGIPLVQYAYDTALPPKVFPPVQEVPKRPLPFPAGFGSVQDPSRTDDNAVFEFVPMEPREQGTEADDVFNPLDILIGATPPVSEKEEDAAANADNDEGSSDAFIQSGLQDIFNPVFSLETLMAAAAATPPVSEEKDDAAVSADNEGRAETAFVSSGQDLYQPAMNIDSLETLLAAATPAVSEEKEEAPAWRPAAGRISSSEMEEVARNVAELLAQVEGTLRSFGQLDLSSEEDSGSRDEVDAPTAAILKLVQDMSREEIPLVPTSRSIRPRFDFEGRVRLGMDPVENFDNFWLME